MPFEGTRISIVLFSRRGWLEAVPQVQDKLRSAGINLPEQDYVRFATLSSEHQSECIEEEAAEVAQSEAGFVTGVGSAMSDQQLQDIGEFVPVAQEGSWVDAVVETPRS